MQRDIALWIDHRQAVLASVAGETEDLRRILSGLAARSMGFEPGGNPHSC